MFTVPVPVGVPVTAGNIGALTVRVIDCAVEAPLAFVATTENVVAPILPEPGIPEITPAALNNAHEGKEPEETVHPPVGIVWLAVRVCEKLAPGDVAKVALLLMVGGTAVIATL